MKTAAPDFKIFWDEAYIVHHLTDEIIETPVLLEESKPYGHEDRVFMFTSTSKITFPGAGVSALACSDNMMKYVCKRFGVMIISYDKMNQLRHVRFLKNKAGVLAHMLKHRRRLVPAFDAVRTTFAQKLTPCGDIAHWTNPKGGYFISLYVMPGCAIIHKANIRSDDIIRDANDLLQKATDRADEIVREASDQRMLEEREYERVRLEVTRFKADVLNLYRSHVESLSRLPEYTPDAAAESSQEEAPEEAEAAAEAPAADADAGKAEETGEDQQAEDQSEDFWNKDESQLKTPEQKRPAEVDYSAFQGVQFSK